MSGLCGWVFIVQIVFCAWEDAVCFVVLWTSVCILGGKPCVVEHLLEVSMTWCLCLAVVFCVWCVSVVF